MATGSAQVDGRAGVLLSGGVLKKVGTVAIDPANQGAGGVFAETFTLQGAEVGDIVFVIPPNTLEADLSLQGAAVTSANTVTVQLKADAAVDGASRTWAFLLIGA